VITLRLTDDQVQLLFGLVEEISVADALGLADPELSPTSHALLTGRTAALGELVKQLRQAQATPYVLRVDDLPHPGVLIEVKPFQKDGLFYVDMNTRGAGHSIGTVTQLGPDRYQASIGGVQGVTLGETRDLEGAMWLCLREWTRSAQFTRILALGRAEETPGGEA
jgi:hypothetical protein